MTTICVELEWGKDVPFSRCGRAVHVARRVEQIIWERLKDYLKPGDIVKVAMVVSRGEE